MTWHFVLRRLLQVVPTVSGILLVAFMLIQLSPGDAAHALGGEYGDAEYYAFIRHRFGLDEPVISQLATYFSRTITGDLGYSYFQGRSVASIVLERAPATLLLTGSALAIAVAISIPLGAVAATRPDGSRAVAISAASLTLYSIPSFWLAQIAIVLVAVALNALPVQGMTTAGRTTSGAAHTLDVARHLILPALVLALQEIAVLVRLTRSALVDELRMDHIRTARAKGVNERIILIRHAMRRALVPAVTVIGARAGHLLSGAAVVEIVFGWPGIGRLLLTSLQARDTPVLLGIFLMVAFAVVMANLITDLVHAAMDPRTGSR